MCKWGTDENVWVQVPASLSYTGKRRWKRVGIDSCIADIVRALSVGGMVMRGSCCGHGKTDGSIVLYDGREIIIPRKVAPENVHPEASCQKCHRPNVQSWHAPSPLWNAVMRDRKTGRDTYSIVCPPCFAEMAEVVIGLTVWCFKPHDVDVTPLWTDGDGRQWDERRCLWVEKDERESAA